MGQINICMLQLFYKIQSRKIAWLLPTAILSVLLIDWHWLALGVLLYFIGFRWHTLVYHEYQVHRYIKPKHWIVELIGYLHLAVVEWQSPKKKILYHQLHHENYLDLKDDPTTAKVKRASNMFLYFLDMTPHVAIPNFNKDPDAEQTALYTWFNNNHLRVLAVSVVAWLIVLPLWSFFAFYLFPMFVWGIVYRSTDWTNERLGLPDRPWAVLYLGTSAFHSRHHLDDSYNRSTYFGTGIYKYLNIDWYIVNAMFDDYKS